MSASPLPRMLLACALVSIFSATAARAVTLTDLRDSGLQSIFGSYGPGGNCRALPVVVIDPTGLSFRTPGGTIHPRSIEYAVSYMGPDYDGITSVLFPFPINADEPGHVVMFVNADEKKGRLTIEDNRGPADRYSPLEATLIRSSPLMLCKPAKLPAR